MSLSTSGLGINVFFSGLLSPIYHLLLFFWKLFWEQNDNILACIRPAPSTGQSDWPWNYPRTGPFLWDALNRAGRAGPSWLRSTRVPASQEPASQGIFYGKNNKGNKGERQKKKSTKPKIMGRGVGGLNGDKTNNAFFKKTVFLGKVTHSNNYFFSLNNFLIQSWGMIQSQL